MLRLVTVLWLLVAALIIFVAVDAAHFSPWQFIIPGEDPLFWPVPLALFGTPLLLIASKFGKRSHQRILAWLALTIVLIPVLGSVTIVIFPKQTGYYDPDDPDRQPGGSPWENRSH